MLRILHLDQRRENAESLESFLRARKIEGAVLWAASEDAILEGGEEFDLVLVNENTVGKPGCNSRFGRGNRRLLIPDAAFSRRAGPRNDQNDLGLLGELIVAEDEKLRLFRKNRGMQKLIGAVEELSLTRSLEAIQIIVRKVARELTGADGATFVLRDGERCHYADEDAIAPLWKGQRFPLSACISGWTMLNRKPAVIEDIYADSRIPADAYRPTFVKSLAMVPIRTQDPIGAIGNYWATRRRPLAEEVELLQALANTTAVSMENVRVYQELEERVKARTKELESTVHKLADANKELDTFSYAVSHDLAAPLRAMRFFTDAILTEFTDQLPQKAKRNFELIRNSGSQMRDIIDDLLRLAKIGRSELRIQKVDLSALASEILVALKHAAPGRLSEIQIDPNLVANVDRGLMRIVLENLLSNAWKYSSKRDVSKISVSSKRDERGLTTFFIKDNGAGFNMAMSDRLFKPFQRLHTAEEFAGTGVGLSTVGRIITRHGGRIWAESIEGESATFYFTLAESLSE